MEHVAKEKGSLRVLRQVSWCRPEDTFLSNAAHSFFFLLLLLLVGYLAYLRRAVKTEQQIRAQRLARAKRSARAEEERRRRAAAVPEFAAAPPPPRLRRPGGATVLEIDDEDPVFDHIPPFQRRRMDREDLQYRRVG